MIQILFSENISQFDLATASSIIRCVDRLAFYPAETRFAAMRDLIRYSLVETASLIRQSREISRGIFYDGHVKIVASSE